jgi:hypothetical protein
MEIPINDRDILEKAIFLPMALIVFNQDLTIIQSSPFKLKDVYYQMVESAMKRIQKDLVHIKREMKNRKLKVHELNRDDLFSQFLFVCKGYEEHHNYFNPAIRNNVKQIMQHYISEKE